MHKFSLICCCMIAAGIVFIAAGYAMGGRVFGIGLGNNGIWVNAPNKNETHSSYNTDSKRLEDFTDMDIAMNYGSLIIEPSDHYEISYCISSAYDLYAEVEDGCLKVTEKYIYHNNFINVNFVFFGIGHTEGSLWQEEYVKIQIPADAEFETVKLANKSGNVTISGLNADTFDLKAYYGDVSLENITSNTATVALESGALSLDRFSGGSLLINDDYGDTTLNNIKSTNADITLESGELTLTEYSDGSLTVNNAYGNAVLETIRSKDISISMESGSFWADDILADTLLLKQEYGAITLQNTVLSKDAELYSENGDISLSDLTAALLKVESDYGKVSGNMLSVADCNMLLESGDCVIDRLDTNNLEINSEYGDVKLGIEHPVTDYALNLFTEYGEVTVNKTALGTIYRSLESHEMSLVINCESGDIFLSDET